MIGSASRTWTRRTVANRELIEQAWRDQRRHDRMTREAERKITAGLAAIRRALR